MKTSRLFFLTSVIRGILVSISPLSPACVTNNSASNFIAGAHLIPIHFHGRESELVLATKALINHDLE